MPAPLDLELTKTRDAITAWLGRHLPASPPPTHDSLAGLAVHLARAQQAVGDARAALYKKQSDRAAKKLLRS